LLGSRQAALPAFLPHSFKNAVEGAEGKIRAGVKSHGVRSALVVFPVCDFDLSDYFHGHCFSSAWTTCSKRAWGLTNNNVPYIQ